MKSFRPVSLTFILTLLIWGTIWAQTQDFPERPNPPRLVNDYAGFLKPDEIARLETKLDTFARSTSTQIAIAIIPDLHGYEISDYATRLAEKWGIGQKGKNNGILILVKPKTGREKGEVFIATGYGMEGAVPDAIAKRIVEFEIIPAFKKGRYFTGLDKATTRLMDLTRGEYTAEQYYQATRKKESTGGTIAGIIMLLLFFFIFFGNAKRSRHTALGRNIPFWTLLFMGGSAGRFNSGSFNDFSSGSGGFGGGFGGFGGGSFGGGGAGGSW